MSSIRPLSGITVIEIGHSVAAPYAGMILGELGAEVIKVENPKGGDACRGWGPPFTDGTATAFHAFNRAKRGITIDLGDPAQVEKLRGLIRERADVLIHNLKYGTLDRYGLSAAALTAEKPSLVYCNIGAFGATGPLRDRPGYDPMMQAYGGLMSLLGEDGTAAGAGHRLDHRHGDGDVGGDRHPRRVAGTRAHRARRGRRHFALRDDARLDDLADLGLSRQWRDPDAARLRGRADRALSGLRRRRRPYHGRGRQRQFVPPVVRRDRPARPRRGSALPHQRRPGRQSLSADPDPLGPLRDPTACGMGGAARCGGHPERADPDSRPGRRRRADRSARDHPAIGRRFRSSDFRCPSTGLARHWPSWRRGSERTTLEIVDPTA